MERFLKWELDPIRRQAALAGALPRTINADLLAAATDTVDAAEAFGWLSRQPFVSAHGGRYSYHNVVRAPMLSWQRQRSPQRWRADHARLADRYRSWQQALVADEEQTTWSDPAWRDYRIAETYHRLCAQEVTLRSAAQDAVATAKIGPTAARQWAEMIKEAGRDAADEEIRGFATRLSASIDSDATDCQEFLTVVLELGRLDSAVSAQALVERARIQYLAGRDEQAIHDCGRAIELDRQCADAYAVRAAAYVSLGRYEQSLADFDQALALSADDVWAIGRRGETYRQLRRFEEALVDLTRAVELDPGYAWAIGGRGEAYRQLGRFEEALVDLTRAVQLDPGYAWAIGSRGQAYRQLGRFEEALVDLTRAVELDPGSAWALGSRGETYRQLGRFEEALVDLTRAVELDPGYAWAIRRRGETYRQLGRFEEALVDLTRAVELDPGYAWAIGGRGETYRQLGRIREADLDFARARELDDTQDWEDPDPSHTIGEP